MAYSARHQHARLVIGSLGVLLFFLWSSFFSSAHVFAASKLERSNGPTKNYHVVTPPISNTVLLNPGKGWVLYGTPEGQTAKTLAYASVGYTRYNWSDIEPEEGLYNWALIDKNMNAWRADGKLFAFGVMNANSSTPTNPYVTPKWIFTDGARSVESQTYDNILKRAGVQYIPVWNDPIFLRKVHDFVTALAKRYDGNPNIAYIDIRSYGNWGVGDVNGLPHSIPLSVKDELMDIQVYRNAFKQTQLILPWGSPSYKNNYAWATNLHIGLRRDGIIVDSNGGELSPAFSKAPIVFEFYGTYQWLSLQGRWNDNKLTTAVTLGRPNYINLGQWGNDGQVMLAQQSQLVQSLANKIGYDFVLSSATLPNIITNLQTSTFSFSWKNQGVSYLYQPASVAVALLDGSNKVVQKQWLPKVSPQAWVPGKTTITNSLITFKKVKKGSYKLAVGLFMYNTDSNPTYKIGNKGQTSTGWYVLGNPIPVK